VTAARPPDHDHVRTNEESQMPTFHRVSVTVSTAVEVSAEDFWQVLRDWAAVPSWVLPERYVPPSRVFLKPGHSADVLPCTRVIEGRRALGYSHEETLILADPDARRIYYTFNGVPGGIRNYLATTTVDERGPDEALVTCSSTFDLPLEASVPDVERYLHQAYDVRISHGIEGAVLHRRAAG
jgi:hypothetical protein